MENLTEMYLRAEIKRLEEELAEAQQGRADDRRDFVSMKQQAGAWIKVFRTLEEVAPGFINGPLNGEDSAVEAIRSLARLGRRSWS